MNMNEANSKIDDIDEIDEINVHLSFGYLTLVHFMTFIPTYINLVS